MAPHSEPLNLGLFRVHLIFFFLFAGFSTVMLGVGVLGLKNQNMSALIGLGLGALFLPIAGLHWIAAAGARDGKSFGRILSRIFGTLWLFGFPLGTLLGLYVWYQTGSSKWHSDKVMRSATV